MKDKVFNLLPEQFPRARARVMVAMADDDNIEDLKAARFDDVWPLIASIMFKRTGKVDRTKRQKLFL
jgi:hypothetical protein